jgi:hypothetical protein
VVQQGYGHELSVARDGRTAGYDGLMQRKKGSLARRLMANVATSEGRAAVVSALANRAWSTSTSFGLAADPRHPPEQRHARVPVRMDRWAPHDFTGFDDELERVTGDDALEVANRIRMCRAGVERLYVATDPDGEAIYAQWLIDSSGQAALHTVVPDLFPPLRSDETLVEGAYTFVRYRRTGAMADGMHQLLTAAAENGATRCLTYVSASNGPSLKGCARVGFDLDHVRLTRRRVGRRSVARRPPEPDDRHRWSQAVAPSG